jgi:D-glycero-D-manno-heptose 1,7-bisphosphate phosphatase
MIGPSRGAIFIDKHGTLIDDEPYNADPAQLRFMPNTLPGLQRLSDAGWPLIIVANQPGLATGRIPRAAFAQVQRTIEQRLRDEAGVELAGWFTCPHSPAALPGCLCRKPAPGLLRQAASSQGIDLGRSWMIGDTLDDVEAGRRAGCCTVLLDVGNETAWRLTPLRQPHHRCADLLDAAGLIAAHTETQRVLAGVRR